MATGAGGDIVVTRRELLAVSARRVLGGLVDALLWRERPHQFRVAVAARTRRDDRLPRRLPLEGHRRLTAPDVVRSTLVRARRIAAVAVDARKALLPVHVSGDEQ